jgi:hypothetical protein
LDTTPLELTCQTCEVVLCSQSETELADLAAQHALSIHGDELSREHVIARINLHNR